MAKRTCIIDDCERPHQARGYCNAHYAKIVAPHRHTTKIFCATCGSEHTTTRTSSQYCSLPCRDKALRAQGKAQYRERLPKPPKPKADLRSPLRRAIEDGGDVIAAVLPDCLVTPDGCWEWQRRIRNDYPMASIAGRWMLVHRLTLEATLGRPLGSQAAHHMCANSKCVNPDHLQPVTHAENNAEMLARTYMTERIRDLESALAALDPSHELLRQVSILT